MTSGGGFDVAAGATVTLAATGVPTGSGELYKSGAGKLVVTSAFVHTGSLDVREGILEFDDAEHLNAALTGLTLSGGQLAFAGAAGTITKDINIAAPGSVRLGGRRLRRSRSTARSTAAPPPPRP